MGPVIFSTEFSVAHHKRQVQLRNLVSYFDTLALFLYNRILRLVNFNK